MPEPASNALPDSILSHVSLGTDDLPRALAFYDAVLETVGARRVEEIDAIGVGYGRAYPEF